MIHDRLMMYVNQAHNIYIKTSVSWFFWITLAKSGLCHDFFSTRVQLQDFSAPEKWKVKFQDQWEPCLTEWPTAKFCSHSQTQPNVMPLLQ